MKECFIEKRFKDSTLEVVAICEGILRDYAAQGYQITLRQLYYQCIAHDVLPDSWIDPKTGSKNVQKNYHRLGSIVNNARVAGLLDWAVMVDLGRSTKRNSHWDSTFDALDSIAEQFRIEKWENQPVHVEVMCEKQAAEGILLPVCRELDVPFTSNKGYPSQSYIYQRGRTLGHLWQGGKEIVVIYFGDHDPSGLDMDRDLGVRLNMFGRVDDYEITIDRLALTSAQIKKYNPPPNPVKFTDSRADGYTVLHGHESWELDALDPAVLANLCRSAILQHRDEDLWDEAVEKEDDMRGELRKLADNAL